MEHEGEHDMTRNSDSLKSVCLGLVAILLLVLAFGCAKEAEKAGGVKKLQAGKANSGLLSDYSNLKPAPRIEGGKALSYKKPDAGSDIRNYVAMMVEPTEIYLAADADEAKVPEKARLALALYLQRGLSKAVVDAFPSVSEKGPLVLKLRAAITGVAPGGAGGEFGNGVNIGKANIEIELVDSVTNQQIAALVAPLTEGDNPEVFSTNIGGDEKSELARTALDGWASVVREFLDAAVELEPGDIQKRDLSFNPYKGDIGDVTGEVKKEKAAGAEKK